MPHSPPSNITRLPCFPDVRAIPIRDFNRHRQDFLRSFDAWLKTSADPAAALAELEGTIGAVRGLVALAFDQLEDHPLITGVSTDKRGAQ